MMDMELNEALSILERLGTRVDDPTIGSPGMVYNLRGIVYWFLSRRGHFVSPDEFQSLCRRLTDLEKNVKGLVKLIARSAAMEN